MPIKDKQIAQEAVRKLALKIAETLFAPNHSDKFPGMRWAIEDIEAELHRALDPLLEAAQEVVAAKTYVFRVLAIDNLSAILEKEWRK